MRPIKRVAGLMVAGALFAATLVGPAYASGGLDSGGSGGGGGTNSGGVNSGGGGSTATTSCVAITNLGNSVGYHSAWAAIWTSISISSKCSGGSSGTWTLTFHNDNTGAIDYSTSGSYKGTYGATIDFDIAQFSAPYTVTLNVRDASGAQLSQSAAVTTPAPKVGL